MSALRVGYDVFSGSSQAGTDASIPGTVQAETAVKGLHRLGIERLSDNQFYNATTKAFVGSRPAEADELSIDGSDSDRGIHAAIRRLLVRIPREALDGITAAGCGLRVYPVGGQLDSAQYSELTLDYKPTTV